MLLPDACYPWAEIPATLKIKRYCKHVHKSDYVIKKTQRLMTRAKIQQWPLGPNVAPNKLVSGPTADPTTDRKMCIKGMVTKVSKSYLL